MTSPLLTPAQVADDALDLLRVAVENIRHMQALFSAIKVDFKHSKHAETEQLADLGAALAYDWGNYHGDQVARAQKDLDALETETGSSQAPTISSGVPLSDYAKGRQAALGAQLGLSQTAINKAMRSGRSIFVIEHADGTISAVEHKAFGVTGYALTGGAK
jgi:hypothetical protein